MERRRSLASEGQELSMNTDYVSALGAKLVQAGIDPAANRLRMAIAEYLNNGGTLERAHAILSDVAHEMRAAGQSDIADKAITAMPASAQPNAGKGRTGFADKAIARMPDPAPNEAAGHGSTADKAIRQLPAASPQSREDGLADTAEKARSLLPSSRDAKISDAGRTLRAARDKHKPGHARNGLAAIAAVQGTIAKSLFDTRLPDGRTYKDIAWSECPMLARTYRRHSRILMAIHSHAVPADPATTIDRVVSEDQMKEIFSAVERFNDVH